MTRIVAILLPVCLFGFQGCTKVDSPQQEAASPEPETQDTPNPVAPDFETMFDTIVKGSLRTATEQEKDAGNRQIEKVVQFNEEENKAFLQFLNGKRDDPSPFVRMEAGFHIALIRNDLGMAKQNEDLIPLFVDLLQHERLWVRNFALNHVDPVIRESNLGEKRQPLVQPLIALLNEPFTTYQAIAYLGDLGPIAKEAVPAIRKAAERDNDPTIDKAAQEAVQKIEGETE